MKDTRSGLYTEHEKHYPNDPTKTLLKRKHSFNVVIPYLNKDMKILDYGCGRCAFYDLIKNIPYKFDYLGYDKDKECVEISKQKGINATSDLNDIEKGYDLILMNSVVEYMPSEELMKSFSLFSRILSKDGILIIETINGKELFNIIHFFNRVGYKHFYTENALMELAELNGLMKIRIVKHHVRINPFKFLIDLLTTDIYCGYTLIIGKK